MEYAREHCSINSVPTFTIGDRIFPGLLVKESLEQAIGAAMELFPDAQLQWERELRTLPAVGCPAGDNSPAPRWHQPQYGQGMCTRLVQRGRL